MNSIQQSMRAIERARKQQADTLSQIIIESNRQAAKLLVSQIYCSTIIAVMLLGWIYA